MPKLVGVWIGTETLEAVGKALRAEADRLQRTATRAAGELDAEVSEGKVTDRRSASVRIVKMLSEASLVSRFATELEEAFAKADATAVPRTVSDVVDDIDNLFGTTEEVPDSPAGVFQSVLDEETLIDPITMKPVQEATDAQG